ncbi:MAG: hypothetical protein U0Q47_07275 [Mycobacterium sp.]
MDSADEQPIAQSLSDITRHSNIAAVFRAGFTGDRHYWELRSAAGELLAVTARVHNGGRAAQVFRKALALTGMDAGNDIHAELRGARGRVLARISSTNAAPATVTVRDDAGSLVAKSLRDKTLLLKVKHPDRFVVFDAEDRVSASVDCEADLPWPVSDDAGALMGELLAGKPGPTLSPHWSDWIDPNWGLSVATYANAQHLGIARAQQYTAVAHGTPSSQQSAVMALLPLMAGLSY